MLENREGQQVPEVTFKMIENGKWQEISTEELFKDKTVIVFSLPGAFTPTCSSKHLPRYNELAGVFNANGIDDIICISVNDTFVMNAWKKDQNGDNITFIPDGNGEFTQKMKLLVDKSAIGFGKRSWRYSMLVKNCVIEKMFIEPQKDGDPFEVSDAYTMLNYINADAQLPDNITLFTVQGCPFCAKAKKLLQEKGLKYEEIIVGNKEITSRSLRAVSGKATVPQVFINGKHIGGSEDLANFFNG